MALREILKYPHPALSQRCKKVIEITEETKKLIEDMAETMYDANGVGLAACQIGVPERVIVLDVSPLDPEQKLFALINPEIVSKEGEIDHEEGCLSVPEFSENVKRNVQVCVRGISPEGNDVELKCEGILAIALQHEIDHLNGVLILDRVSRLKREIYRNRVKKEKKKEEKD